MKVCEDAGKYIVDNNLEGKYTDDLKAYLEEYVEPCTIYPNGSHSYIMEELNLDDEGIAIEMAFVSQMLEYAIAGGLTPGAEITRLLENADFAKGTEGWNVETDGVEIMSYPDTAPMPILRSVGKGSFSISQSLKELPNGIYVMSLNALFRAGDDIYNNFYAGQLCLNNTVNYVMSAGEDVIQYSEAEPGVNCLGEGSDIEYDLDGIAGWVPNASAGYAIAYGAGRYQNFVATEVNDGKLTIGVRSLGTGLNSDWLPFGNMHVYYLGTADTANEELTKILNAYVARANVIANFQWSEYEEYNKYPNMSEQLKTELNNAIAKAGEAEDKMALINTFSDLFNQIHACRKAYIALTDALNKLSDTLDELDVAGLISNEAYEQWESEIWDAQDHYRNGDISTEEALAIVERFNNSGIMPQPVDGVYQLKSAADLAIFSMIVNRGELTANAVLLNDIDMADLGEGFSWKPIGNWGSTPAGSAGYKGHFDGQGHTIKNFRGEASQNWFGLFGVLSDNAFVENFNIEGDITTEYQYTGSVAGYARDKNVTIRGIHSYVNIMSLFTGGRTGGLLGCVDNGQTRVERCTYSGTLDGYDNGGGGNYGGIVGYTNNSTSAVCDITDCLFDGKLINTVDVPGNCTFGGMVGYTNSSIVTIKNCLSIGTVQSARYAQFFGALNGTNSKIINSYYKGDYINGSSSGQQAHPQEAIQVTDAQLQSGEICYKLNGDQSTIVWHQTIATDAYPVLDADHQRVWFSDGEYTNADPDGIRDIQTAETVTVQTGIYNLAGQRLEKLQKGINIVNGKKVLVK